MGQDPGGSSHQLQIYGIKNSCSRYSEICGYLLMFHKCWGMYVSTTDVDHECRLITSY